MRNFVRYTAGAAVAAGLLSAAACFRQVDRTVTIQTPQLTRAADGDLLVHRLTMFDTNMVKRAEYDLKAHTVTVTYDSTMTALKNLEMIIAASGFDANDTPKIPPRPTRTAPAPRPAPAAEGATPSKPPAGEPPAPSPAPRPVPAPEGVTP